MINYSYLAPPPAAHNIVHTDYYIKHNEREKGARKIYETVQYDAYEMERIKELKEEIQKLNITLPSDWKESDYLKIGYSGRFKMKEVIKKLQLHLSWRNNPIYHQINPAIEKFLQNGICYVFGRDKQYRPIVILNAHLIDLKKYDKETIIQSLSFMMGIIRKHMFIPGKVENWLFILESNGLGVFGLPVKALQVVIDTMSTNFGGCLEKMFILNPSSGLNFLWKTISGFLDPETAQKINFMQQKDFKKLLEFIDVRQLEQKYGGEQPNQQKFWPPYNLDLIDGRTVPKQQNEAIKQSIQQNQNQDDDPYDKVEFNVHDFLETQKKLYSMDYTAKPQQQQEPEERKEEVVEKQQEEPEVPEIVPQQQIENDQNDQGAIQQQDEQPLKESPAEQPQPQVEEPVTPRLHEPVTQIQQEEPEKQNNEEQVFSAASATKIPIEVQAQNVEMSKVDPVANNAACCQTCSIF